MLKHTAVLTVSVELPRPLSEGYELAFRGFSKSTRRAGEGARGEQAEERRRCLRKDSFSVRCLSLSPKGETD